MVSRRDWTSTTRFPSADPVQELFPLRDDGFAGRRRGCPGSGQRARLGQFFEQLVSQSDFLGEDEHGSRTISAEMPPGLGFEQGCPDVAAFQVVRVAVA